MSEHFNQLTPAEAELLAILSEECGEVVQMVGKILRHGLDSDYKAKGKNRELLTQEIGDVMVTTLRLVQEKVLDFDGLDKAMLKKAKKNGHLHHAGPLEQQYIDMLVGDPVNV